MSEDVCLLLSLLGVVLVLLSLAVDVVHQHRYRHWPRRAFGVCVHCTDLEWPYEEDEKEDDYEPTH